MPNKKAASTMVNAALDIVKECFKNKYYHF